MSEYEPITGELRAALDVDREFMRADGAVVAQTFCVDRGDFDRLCDAIDAVHAGLERENAELRQRVAELDKRGGSMHDGGSITGELREYAEAYEGSATHASLDLIADRIDAEHESACAEAYGNGVMSVPIALDESAWVELPKDADGVPIRVGDVMEERSGHTFEVASLMAFGGSDNWLVLSDPRNFASFREPNDIRHYHAPTVEDVLREFADAMSETHPMDVPARIDEYAAKLRLAGDAE